MTESNPWKLGLFVVVGVLAAVGAVFWLAAQRLNPEVLPAVSYFNESVEGLDVGAPIKIRGVKVGVVSDIGIGPDQRMVEVRMRLFVRSLIRLGFWPSIQESQLWGDAIAPPDLRVQVVSQGITGVKFVQADFFDPESTPMPELSFDPGPNYVASAPSTLKGWEDGLTTMLELLPRALEKISTLVEQVTTVVEEARVGELATSLERTLEQLRERLTQFDSQAVSSELTGLGSEARALIERMDALIAGLEDEQGALMRTLTGLAQLTENAGQELQEARLADTTASLRTSAASFGSLGTDSTQLPEELRQTMVRLRETLSAVTDLAELLERDPGALLRGRSVGTKPSGRSDG